MSNVRELGPLLEERQRNRAELASIEAGIASLSREMAEDEARWGANPAFDRARADFHERRMAKRHEFVKRKAFLIGENAKIAPRIHELAQLRADEDHAAREAAMARILFALAGELRAGRPSSQLLDLLEAADFWIFMPKDGVSQERKRFIAVLAKPAKPMATEVSA